jgi:hypothetical protein
LAGGEKLSEEELAALVTRNAMVGIAKVKLPQPGANPRATRKLTKHPKEDERSSQFLHAACREQIPLNSV